MDNDNTPENEPQGPMEPSAEEVPETWSEALPTPRPEGMMSKAAKGAELNPRRIGRTTLLTPELQEAFLDLLKRGNYTATAAKAVGIRPETISVWIRRGKDLEASGLELDEYEQTFVSFAKEVEKARSMAEIKAVEVIRNAMPSQWQAAAWFLERTNNAQWGRTVRTEVTGADGGPVQVDVDSVYRKLEALSQQIVDVTAVEAGETDDSDPEN